MEWGELAFHYKPFGSVYVFCYVHMYFDGYKTYIVKNSSYLLARVGPDSSRVIKLRSGSTA